MTPSNILRFYALRLRVRLVQELFAVIGIAVGVALLFASQVANSSLSGSVNQLTTGIVGQARLQLAARDSHGFDERLLKEVQRLPGVQTAAPVLEANADIIGPTGRRSVDLIGVDPSFVNLRGPLLRHFTATQLAAQQALALPAVMAQELGAGPLQTVKLDIDGRRMEASVGIVLREPEIGSIVHSPIVVAPLAYAQKLARKPNRITRVLVQPAQGHDRAVNAELARLASGRIDVRSANFDAGIFRQAEGPTSQSTELFSAISALVGFLFAFDAMLLTAPQRRNLVADLRLDGYTPWEVTKILLVDALILGVAGSLVGLLLGDLLARSFVSTSPGYLSLAFAVGSQRIVTWQCIAVAAAGGMIAAGLGVLNPLKDIFSHRPTTNRPTGSSRPYSRRLPQAGLFFLGATLAMLWAGIENAPTAIAALVFLMAALLSLLPSLFNAVLSVFDRLQQSIASTSPHLALIELRSNATRTRSLAIAATGAVAVFGSVAIEGARRNLQRGLDRVDVEVNNVADLWITPSGAATTLATVPFGGDSKLVSRLIRLPSVRSVAIYRGSFLDLGDHRTLVIAPPRSSPNPIPSSQISTGNLSHATGEIRRHGWITVSQSIAHDYHLHVGQLFSLPAPHPTTFRIAATTTNFGWPSGSIVINADDYARAWGSRDPSAYQIMLRPGFRLEAARSTIAAILGPDSALTVQTARRREGNDRASQHQGLARLSQISTLVLIAAVLAMAAAMGALIWQRRRRLASMKVDGFAHSELWRALIYESTLLLGTSCAIGAVFGLYGQLLLSRALVTVTGFPATFSVGPLVAASSVTLVTTIAILIVAVPGYVAAGVRPTLQE